MLGEEQFHKSKYFPHEAACLAVLGGHEPGAVVGGGDSGEHGDGDY